MSLKIKTSLNQRKKGNVKKIEFQKRLYTNKYEIALTIKCHKIWFNTKGKLSQKMKYKKI